MFNNYPAASARGGTRRTAMFVLAILALVAGVFAVTATAAPGDPSSIEMDAFVRYDGLSNLADPAFATNTDGQHTPGADANRNNNVVRSFDRIGYAINWNANDATTTNQVITVRLPAGTHWAADPNYPPFKGCLSGGVPESSISADQRTLVCNVRTAPEGTNGQIRPVAVVEPANGERQLYDGEIVTAQVSMMSDQVATPLTASLSVTVSAAPQWNWVKHEPEVLPNVTRNGVPGMVHIYPLTFEPGGSNRIGSEPVRDSSTIRFYDHAVDLTPGAVWAEDALLGGRSRCGGYDGTGAYPYGQTGIGNANNTTTGAHLGSENVNCYALNTNSYPTVRIDVSGHRTETRPAQNVDGSPNRAGVSAQVAFWMPQSEVDAKADASDGTLGNNTGTATFQNAIAATADAVDVPAYPNPVVVDPIQVQGTGGPTDETGTKDNSVWSAFSLDPQGEIGGSTGGGSAWLQHRTRFLPAIQTAETSTTNEVTGTASQMIDTRPKSVGGMGREGLSKVEYIQNGTVSRSQTIIAELSIQASAAQRDAPISGCMRWENEHAFVSPFPAQVKHSTVTGVASGSTNTAIGTASTSPSTWAHAIIGQSTIDINDVYTVYANPDGATPFGDLGIDDRIIIEFAHIDGDLKTIGTNATTCNQSDAAAPGWVGLNQVATAFPVDANGLSKDINAVRVRTVGDVPWHNVAGTELDAGTQLTLAVPLKVGSSLIQDPNGTRIRLHSSRAWGAWNPSTDDRPPTPQCGAIGNTGGDIALNSGPQTGWCGRAYNYQAEGSDTFQNGIFKTAIDPSSFTQRSTGNSGRMVHSDMIEIVAPRLQLDKEIVRPKKLVADNGDEVEYTLAPAVVGSPEDLLHDIRMTDLQPASLEYVSSSVTPDGFTLDGQPYWDFGDQYGGWVGPVIDVVYRVTGTQGDTTINNHAQITSPDAETIDDYAQVFTPPIAARSNVVKGVAASQGECPMYPDGTAAPAWFEAQCESYNINDSITWDLTVTNNGNSHLSNYAIVDVFPYDEDGGTGDTRTPASRMSGRLQLADIAVTSSQPYVVYYSKDTPSSISRDPRTAATNTTWCDAPANGAAIFGNTAECPTSQAEVTAVYVSTTTLRVDQALSVDLTLQPVNAACDDVYTNNFGGRTDSITLPVRSNDETVMVDCTYDLALLKDVATSWSPGADWLTPGTTTADFTLTVFNQGDPIEDFDVTDYLPADAFGPFEVALNPPSQTGGDAQLDYTWTGDGTNQPVAKVTGVLGAGQRVTLPITVKVSPDWTGAPLLNTAEISRFDNNGDAGDGDSDPNNPDLPVTGALTDADSTPDQINTDPLVDGIIDNSLGDEDDHDVALLPHVNMAVEKVFNQASPDTEMPLRPGGPASFNITLTNKGTLAVRNPQITDVIDTTKFKAFDAGLNPDGTTSGDHELAYTWSANGDDGVVDFTGVIQPGRSVTLPVNLLIADDAAMGTLVNHVEITDITAVDVDGNPVGNGGSSGTGLGTDIDLSDNADDAPVQYLDMALTKTIAYTSDTTVLPPKAGEPITFDLHVSNEGTTWVKDPTVIDYVDTSMWSAFDVIDNAPGTTTVNGRTMAYTWTGSGLNGALAITGTLAPGETITIPVTLRVAPDATPKVLENVAEISSEQAVGENGDPVLDEDDEPIQDWDSTPDTINQDPAAEDDHDRVAVRWYDVGVLKSVDYAAPTSQLPVRNGGTVTFDLAVTNHGNTRAENIELTDTVNTTMWQAFDPALNPAGTTVGDRTLPYTWTVDAHNSNDGFVTFTGVLEPGETVHLPVTLRVGDQSDLKDLLNVITVTGGTPIDEDGNTVTTEVGDPLPDADSTNNEDDAEVPRRPVYDLSLEKSIDPDKNSLPIKAGGSVTYTLSVANEGSVDVTDITVIDYLPKELTLNDPAWTAHDDGTATRDLGVTLKPGESASVDITFLVPKDLVGQVDNEAEVGAGTPIDEDGKPIIDSVTGKPITDEDSTPANAKEGEDDVDSVSFLTERYDLALEKTVGEDTPALLRKGNKFTFEFHVTNEGTLPVTGFTLVDNLPAGLEVPADGSHGWTLLDDGSLTISVDKTLRPGETYVAYLPVVVTIDGYKVITNHAEITELRGPGGQVVDDYDAETGDLESDASVTIGKPDVSGHGRNPAQPISQVTPRELAITGLKLGGLAVLAAGMILAGFWLARRRPRSVHY